MAANANIGNMNKEELLKHIEKIDEKMEYYVCEFRQYFMKTTEGEKVDRTTYFYLRKARYAFKQAMRLDEEKEEAESRLWALGFEIDTKKREENFEE